MTGAAPACELVDNQMTLLHILTMNPHTTLDTIIACYNINPDATIAEGSEITTPMEEYARTHNIEGLIVMVCLSVEK